MFTYYEQSGLGLVVTQTTKFDPRHMAARKRYWHDIYFKEIVNQIAEQYRAAGFEGLSGLSDGAIPLYKIPLVGNVASMITGITANIPVVGKLFCGVFGGCEKPKIPWGEIYAMAEPIAKQYGDQSAIDEERNRIAEEGVRIQTERQTAGEKRSQEGALFKLPEGVTSISRGALVMKLKGGPVEKRL